MYQPTETTDPSVDPIDETIVRILTESPQAKSSLGGNLSALVISLLLFAWLGLFEWSIIDLGILVIVILIHESGHLVAMKAFGYKDLRMLFLPFLGAIVSGRSETNRNAQKAIVSLAGPLPGIGIGVVLLIIAATNLTDDPLLAANLFIFLNLFNLLPIYPLDGGRFFDDILFSRNFVVEAISKGVAIIAIVVLAYTLEAWLLLIILLGTAASLRQSAYTNKTIRNLEVSIDTAPLKTAALSTQIVRQIRQNIEPELLSDLERPEHLAQHVDLVWRKVSAIHPSVLATMALLALYIFSFVIGIATLGGIEDVRSIVNGEQ